MSSKVPAGCCGKVLEVTFFFYELNHQKMVASRNLIIRRCIEEKMLSKNSTEKCIDVTHDPVSPLPISIGYVEKCHWFFKFSFEEKMAPRILISRVPRIADMIMTRFPGVFCYADTTYDAMDPLTGSFYSIAKLPLPSVPLPSSPKPEKSPETDDE